MKNSKLGSKPHRGRSSREAPRAGTEASFLEERASNARSALKSAFRDLGADLGRSFSLRSWVREFPWASIGLGALAGLAAGYGTRRQTSPGRSRGPRPCDPQ